MAKYSDIRSAVLNQWKQPNGNAVRYLIEGAPGGGKSVLCRDIADQIAAKEDQYEMTLSLYDTPDLMGLPDLSGDCSFWKPPMHLKRLAEASYHRPVVIKLEEFTDATTPVFNASCQLLLDNKLGDLHFGNGLYIIANGNRTQDKSGANRIPTKAANRLRIKEFDTNLDEWIAWSRKAGIRYLIPQFLRMKPEHLYSFDPNRKINATCRSWERVNMIDHDQPEHILFDEVRGDVGDGIAAEYVGFIKIANSLPSKDEILKDPLNAHLPDEPGALYAISGMLSHHATPQNFADVIKYADRMKSVFQVMTISDALEKHPELRKSPAFTAWAAKGKRMF